MQKNQVRGFLPSVSGLEFSNSFPSGTEYPVIELPFGLPPIEQDASLGLCGGFVFTVLDMFLHYPRIPGSAAGVDTPPDPSPLFDYLCERLLESFGTNPPLCNAVKYVQWIQDPNTDQYVDIFGSYLVYWKGLNDLIINEEWPAIKRDIDAGMPSPLSLVMTPECGPLDVPGIVDALGHSHQVLAFAYEVNDDDYVTLWVYDPNQPDKNEITLGFSLTAWQGNESHNDPIAVNSSDLNQKYAVRGLFRTQYVRRDPPIEVPPPPGLSANCEEGGPYTVEHLGAYQGKAVAVEVFAGQCEVENVTDEFELTLESQHAGIRIEKKIDQHSVAILTACSSVAIGQTIDQHSEATIITNKNVTIGQKIDQHSIATITSRQGNIVIGEKIDQHSHAVLTAGTTVYIGQKIDQHSTVTIVADGDVIIDQKIDQHSVATITSANGSITIVQGVDAEAEATLSAPNGTITIGAVQNGAVVKWHAQTLDCPDTSGGTVTEF